MRREMLEAVTREELTHLDTISHEQTIYSTWQCGEDIFIEKGKREPDAVYLREAVADYYRARGEFSLLSASEQAQIRSAYILKQNDFAVQITIAHFYPYLEQEKLRLDFAYIQEEKRE